VLDSVCKSVQGEPKKTGPRALMIVVISLYAEQESTYVHVLLLI